MQTEVLKYSLKDGQAVIRSWDDVEPILEHNKLLRSMPQKSDWGRHIASIPNIVLMKWIYEEWNAGHEIRMFSEEFNRLVAKRLQDPDWAYLRTDK